MQSMVAIIHILESNLLLQNVLFQLHGHVVNYFDQFWQTRVTTAFQKLSPATVINVSEHFTEVYPPTKMKC